jgi:subtilisin family serine protease
MDPLAQTKIQYLMKLSAGRPDITIGLIDGPVDLNHPAFDGSTIAVSKESLLSTCRTASSIACMHGTFIAGILCAKRGFSAPAICPRCTLLIRPIFTDTLQSNKKYPINAKERQNGIYFPASNPAELSKAIVEVVDRGANIINLSLGLSNSSITIHTELQDAYNYACNKGVIIVASSGNQGNIGGMSHIDNNWIIPVASCNQYGYLDFVSNIGCSIGKRGLLAPGVNITSASSGGGYIQMSGTSCATPFVTGSIALLWSMFPNASAAQLIYSIRMVLYRFHHRSIIPPILNAELAYTILKYITSK